MTLGEKQRLFSKLLGRTLVWIHTVDHHNLVTLAIENWAVTLGEAYRPKEMADLYAERGIGIKGSLHGDRLAIDLNLFIDGVYQTQTEAYKPLGEYWESLHPDCRWGGRFDDGNHFSITDGGRK